MPPPDIKSQLTRTPITRRPIQLILAISAIALILIGHKSFIKYDTRAPLEMLAAIATGAILFTPTYFYLAYLTRHNKKPWWMYVLIPLSVILFFAPLAGATNNFCIDQNLRAYQFVGFSEESWKIAPFLLILLLARPLIRDVRDGVFYGALAGLGFSCLEMGAYFALEDFPKTGWDTFWTNTIGRASLVGFDMHIFWSAFLGSSIIYGLSSTKKLYRFLIPISCFLLVAATHGLQDSAVGKIITFLPFGLIEPVFIHYGATEESLTPYILPMTIASSTISLLLMNIFIWPIFIWQMKHNRNLCNTTTHSPR